MGVRYKLPDGMQDFIGDECYSKSVIENIITSAFIKRGYEKIETPALEYENLFTTGFGAVDEKVLFKTTDTDGSILALRPDMTLPISRVVSTKLNNDYPIRLYYNADSYALSGSYHKLRDFTQTGVELIGSSSKLSDVEILSLAIECLKSTGLDDFKIDIGHVGFFKGILSSLNISEEDKLQIIDLVQKKDMLQIELISKRLNLDNDFVKILSSIPLLYGGVEVIKEAEQFANNDCSRDALKNLNEIFNYLKTMGLSDYITIDLGNANAMHYYSGIVFKGITKFSGSPILAGGRYDDLCKSFNKSLPATGFAIGIKNLLISLDRAGKLFKNPKVDFMVGYEEGAEATVLQHINKLRNDGFTVVNTFINDEQKFIEIKNLKKAFSYIYIRKSGEIKTLNG